MKKKSQDKEAKKEFSIKDIPAPHVIKSKLDQYVIGQEQAKKVIAVAVCNHYKRAFCQTSGQEGAEDDVQIEKVQYPDDWTNRKRKDVSGKDAGKAF